MNLILRGKYDRGMVVAFVVVIPPLDLQVNGHLKAYNINDLETCV